jgi:acyl-CoA reductase-like NAD-dependent aldehyde dehydrogenase
VAALAVYGAFNSPSFVAGLTALAAAAAAKAIVTKVESRNTPEIEARMAECYRRGGTWDNFKKRCKD